MSVFKDVLSVISGGKTEKLATQLLFDKVIGFRGIIDGVGASTVIQNVAVALSETTDNSICVVDTHILYPAMAQLLGGKQVREATKDWFDFVDDISVVAHKTRYKHVYHVGFYNRTIVDIVSSKDSSELVLSLFAALKDYFDIILVDLSLEPTVISSITAIQCNKIYSVIDSSLACLSNLRASINNVVTLGVPTHKLHRVVAAKVAQTQGLDIGAALKEYNLQLISVIPCSDEIAKFGVHGDKIWGALSTSKAVTAYNIAIEDICKDILESNDLEDNLVIHNKTEEVAEVSNYKEAIDYNTAHKLVNTEQDQIAQTATSIIPTIPTVPKSQVVLPPATGLKTIQTKGLNSLKKKV